MSTSDRIVTTRHVQQAQRELQQLGLHKATALLECEEPDIAEFLLESHAAFYHTLLHAGISCKHARRLNNQSLTIALICLKAQRKAQAELWSDLIEPQPE